MENIFSWLPSVEEVLNSGPLQGCQQVERNLQTDAARQVLTDYRLKMKADRAAILQQFASKEQLKTSVYQAAAEAAQMLGRNKLHPVVNATGIVLHTNLGRAPLAEAAQAAVQQVISGYCNLELDLENGNRSVRYQNVEKLISDLTGAEACLVVNNNAAAVLLALETMAKGKEGVISRGQLVEIGGSFRVPEVMEKSGVTLKEVGTTNKTRLSDYQNAITDETGILLVVHPSNFHMTGFVASPSLAEIARLGQEKGIATLYDWGCGALYPLVDLKIGREQTIKKIIATGVDVVTFSGDKLLGGPQCGIIIGKRQIIEAMRNNPFTRALRVDKMALAALEGTLRCYGDSVSALNKIPVLRQLTKPLPEVKELAAQLLQQLQALRPSWDFILKESTGEVGGGSLPDVLLPTYIVAVRPHVALERLAKELRTGNPAVLGFIKEGYFCLDARTILPGEIEAIATAFQYLSL